MSSWAEWDRAYSFVADGPRMASYMAFWGGQGFYPESNGVSSLLIRGGHSEA